MNKIYLSETYKNIYSLPIGMKAINNNLKVGPVSIFINNRQEVYGGKLNENGVISGLSQLFREQNLRAGMIFSYENHDVASILLYLNDDSAKNEMAGNQFADSPSKKLKWPPNSDNKCDSHGLA